MYSLYKHSKVNGKLVTNNLGFRISREPQASKINSTPLDNNACRYSIGIVKQKCSHYLRCYWVGQLIIPTMSNVNICMRNCSDYTNSVGLHLNFGLV